MIKIKQRKLKPLDKLMVINVNFSELNSRFQIKISVEKESKKFTKKTKVLCQWWPHKVYDYFADHNKSINKLYTNKIKGFS